MVRIEDVLVSSLAEDFLGLSFEACFTFGIMPKELLRGLCAGIFSPALHVLRFALYDF